MEPQVGKVILDLKNTRPVDLFDLSRAFDAFAKEYKRSLFAYDDPYLQEEVSLHVTSIRSGSIIAELAALAPYALPIVENANTIFDFCSNLKTAFDWLRGEGTRPKEVEPDQLENYASIVGPVVKDAGSQLNIQGGISAQNVTIINNPIIIALDHTMASRVQEGANRELALLTKRKAGLHEKVVLSWYQARNDPKSKNGDRAIIESIEPRSIRALFVNASVKAKMLSGVRNPFKQAYLVDVMVETVQNKPVLYRILEVHEVIKKRK
jgi:hypothetical protein